MFIFTRRLRSSPANYELDIIQVTTVFIIRKNWENNETEKIGLIISTPDQRRIYAASRKIYVWAGIGPIKVIASH